MFAFKTYRPIDRDIELNGLESSLGPFQFSKPLPALPTDKALPKLPFWKTVDLETLRHGWRFGAALGAVCAILVLLLNIFLTIWGSLRSSANGGHIHQGSCHKADRINMGLHMVINVLSTLLLAASNYCMQCLCAPTRSDIESAHRQGRWLDIGVQSLRNIQFVRPLKRWLWFGLAASSR